MAVNENFAFAMTMTTLKNGFEVMCKHWFVENIQFDLLLCLAYSISLRQRLSCYTAFAKLTFTLLLLANAEMMADNNTPTPVWRKRRHFLSLPPL